MLRGDPVAPELRWRDEEGVHRSQGRPRPSPREQLGQELGLAPDPFDDRVRCCGLWELAMCARPPLQSHFAMLAAQITRGEFSAGVARTSICA